MKICPTEEIKRELRRQNFAKEMLSPSRCVEEAIERARTFWTDYEQFNRDNCPDDPVYSIVNAGATLSTTADTLTFQAASAGAVRVLEIIIGGEATASAVNRLSVARGGTSITGNSAITPEKFNSRSPNNAGTYGKSGTQTLNAAMLSIGFNAFGGFIRWVAGPGEEIYLVNSEVLSCRSASGTSIVSMTGIFEEL